MTSLWNHEHYNAPVNFIFDRVIAEYDISKANISVLLDAGIIDYATYERLYHEDRMVRQYEIGIMSKDKVVKDALQNGFKIARKSLCEQLELEDQNILHIVKDAIFVVSKIIGGVQLPDSVQVSDHVVFTKRSMFNSYFKIGPSIYFYYSYDFVSDKSYYKIRGMSEEAQNLHSNYFINILCDIAKTRHINGSKAAYEKAREWYDFLSTHSAIETYMYKRRFDSSSMFDLKQVSSFCTFKADYLSEGAEMMVDGSYNLGLISYIGNCLLSDMINGR